MAKQSSNVLSSLASKYSKIKSAELVLMATTNVEKLTKEVRSLAASVMSQDEVKGRK